MDTLTRLAIVFGLSLLLMWGGNAEDLLLLRGARGGAAGPQTKNPKSARSRSPPPPSPVPSSPPTPQTPCQGGSPFWDVEKYPEYEGAIRCGSSNECRATLTTTNCCLVNFCFCGFFRPGFESEECVF